MIFNSFLTKHKINFYFFLILSLIFLINGKVINKDGALYLAQAQHFFEGRYNDGYSQMYWPFYGFLIACSSYIFKNVHLSAIVLNFFTIFFLFNTFLKVGRNLFENKFKHIDIAIFISFILFYRYLNNYALFIIRDHGYLLFVFLYINFLFNYIDHKKNIYLLFSLTALLISFLFRPESLFLLPTFFYTLFNPKRDYKKISMYLVYSLLVIGLFLFCFSFFKDLKIYEYKHRLVALLGMLANPPIVATNANLEIIVNNYKPLILFFTFLIALVSKFFGIMGIFNGSLFIVGLTNKVSFKKILSSKKNNILYLIIIINLILVFLNFYATYIFSARYLLLVALISILYCVPLVYKIYSYSLSSYKLKIFSSCMLFIIFLATINPLRKNPAELDAVNWINKNYPDANVFFNQPRHYVYNKQYIYFFDRDIDYNKVFNDYDLLVFQNHKNTQMITIPANFNLIKKFPEAKSKIFVYKK